MTKQRHITAALLAGVVAVGGAACGGGSKHSSTTATTASTPQATTTPGKTTTTGKSTPAKPKPTSAPKSNQPPLSQTPAKTLTFTGSGVKDIGKPNPLRIPKDSTIQWTNTGAIFQIIPASVKVQSPVNSKAHSGTATVKKGAYYGFLINAIGNWTVKIIPD
jgi:hypothetical protein